MSYVPLIALQVSTWETEDQTVRDDQIGKYLGDWKGIQGHQNSCYLDATIFGLFALSNEFDDLFLNSGVLQKEDTAALTPAQQVQRDIGNMLWRGIVNPLRKSVLTYFTCIVVYMYCLT